MFIYGGVFLDSVIIDFAYYYFIRELSACLNWAYFDSHELLLMVRKARYQGQTAKQEHGPFLFVVFKLKCHFSAARAFLF